MRRLLISVLCSAAVINLFPTFTDARQYNPNTGRFTRRDPIQYAETAGQTQVDLYTYVIQPQNGQPQPSFHSPSVRTEPIGYADGINLYSYVQNNPINFVDPMGLQCKKTIIGSHWNIWWYNWEYKCNFWAVSITSRESFPWDATTTSHYHHLWPTRPGDILGPICSFDVNCDYKCALTHKKTGEIVEKDWSYIISSGVNNKVYDCCESEAATKEVEELIKVYTPQ